MEEKGHIYERLMMLVHALAGSNEHYDLGDGHEVDAPNDKWTELSFVNQYFLRVCFKLSHKQPGVLRATIYHTEFTECPGARARELSNVHGEAMEYLNREIEFYQKRAKEKKEEPRLFRQILDTIKHLCPEAQPIPNNHTHAGDAIGVTSEPKEKPMETTNPFTKALVKLRNTVIKNGFSLEYDRVIIHPDKDVALSEKFSFVDYLGHTHHVCVAREGTELEADAPPVCITKITADDAGVSYTRGYASIIDQLEDRVYLQAIFKGLYTDDSVGSAKRSKVATEYFRCAMAIELPNNNYEINVNLGYDVLTLRIDDGPGCLILDLDLSSATVLPTFGHEKITKFLRATADDFIELQSHWRANAALKSEAKSDHSTTNEETMKSTNNTEIDKSFEVMEHLSEVMDSLAKKRKVNRSLSSLKEIAEMVGSVREALDTEHDKTLDEILADVFMAEIDGKIDAMGAGSVEIGDDDPEPPVSRSKLILGARFNIMLAAQKRILMYAADYDLVVLDWCNYSGNRGFSFTLASVSADENTRYSGYLNGRSFSITKEGDAESSALDAIGNALQSASQQYKEFHDSTSRTEYSSTSEILKQTATELTQLLNAQKGIVAYSQHGDADLTVWVRTTGPLSSSRVIMAIRDGSYDVADQTDVIPKHVFEGCEHILGAACKSLDLHKQRVVRQRKQAAFDKARADLEDRASSIGAEALIQQYNEQLGGNTDILIVNMMCEGPCLIVANLVGTQVSGHTVGEYDDIGISFLLLDVKKTLTTLCNELVEIENS